MEASKRRRAPETDPLHMPLKSEVSGGIHAWRRAKRLRFSVGHGGVEGRRFESDHPDQKKKKVLPVWEELFCGL